MNKLFCKSVMISVAFFAITYCTGKKASDIPTPQSSQNTEKVAVTEQNLIEQNTEKNKPEISASEQNAAPANEGMQNDVPKLFNLFREAVFYENIAFIKLTTDKKMTLYSIDSKYVRSVVGELEANSDIEILGDTDSWQEEKYGSGYYLINVTKNNTLWSGWVDKKELSIDSKSEQDYRTLPISTSEISPDNLHIAISTGWEGKIELYDRSGRVICTIPFSTIQERKPDAADGRVIGWSNDSKYVWAETNMDSYTVCFIRIDSDSGDFEIIDRPDNFASSQIHINYDNGNAVYTNFPFQFDTEGAEQTKKSGKEFTLFKTNLLTRGTEILATNRGGGFYIEEAEAEIYKCKKMYTEEVIIVDLN